MRSPHRPQGTAASRHAPGGAGAQLWRPDLEPHTGPTYQAIAAALAADIAAGRLAPGARLPSQRTLARALGVNLTTITRAMREAERRGLVSGLTGSGTFVAPRVERQRDWATPDLDGAPADLVDLGLNVPPDVAEPVLARALAKWAATLARNEHFCRSLLPYRAPEGSTADRAAAVAWLAERGVDADPDQVVITNGAQHGLSLALDAVASPGDAVLCEALTYPGLRAAAELRGVRLIPVTTDENGLVPAAVRAALRRHTPRAIVCVPTLHNPTATTLPLSRRRELAALARRSGTWLIEDDVYGALARSTTPPLYAHAPERTIYITSLSKTVAPGLRVGYLAAGDPRMLDALRGALRASTWMTAPTSAAIASAWIRDGVAHQAVRLVRGELARRQQMARRILSALIPDSAAPAADAPAPHLWIPLPDAAAEAAVVARLTRAGVGVTSGKAFRAGGDSHGFRVCLGAAPSRDVLTQALRTICETMAHRDAGVGRMVL